MNQEKFSIWLVPSDIDVDFINIIIHSLSKKYLAPTFMPHCTIFSPIIDINKAQDTIEQFVDFATSLANSELMSYMYFNFAFGCVAINLACIFPIRPAPIKEKLIIIK